MKNKIGFGVYEEEKTVSEEKIIPTEKIEPVKSLVQVKFPDCGRSYAYFNDQFDLHVGDVVFVEGKMEGTQGIVINVSYSFKIRLSDYKRVIAVADDNISGKLYFGGPHLIAFDKSVIPYEKIRGWYLPPVGEDEYVVSSDGKGILLEDFEEFEFRPEIVERGVNYFRRCKVVYLCLQGIFGRAIVEGSKPYELTFNYDDGEVSNLTCDCFCSFRCKHEFALLLQLRETLRRIEKNYGRQYEESDYFAAISKADFIAFALHTERAGSMELRQDTD